LLKKHGYVEEIKIYNISRKAMEFFEKKENTI